MQKELHQLELSEKNTKQLLRIACRACWLSISQSMESVLHNYLH